MSAVLDLRAPARAVGLSLPPAGVLQRPAIATWRERMSNEHGSARVFEVLATQCRRLGRDDDARELASFADEERRHGVLCGAVVEALGGEATAPSAEPRPIPLHEDADTPLEALLRNVLSVCCASETVAVALIGAERSLMPAGPLRQLLTEIWADEVGHARFGWRLLATVDASLDASMRARLRDYVEVALAHLVAHELAHLPLIEPPRAGASLGLCNGRDARSLLFDAIDTVILPGLARHGLAPQTLLRRGSTLHAAPGSPVAESIDPRLEESCEPVEVAAADDEPHPGA
ncbi:MAG: ferritin-like domain-containing protein [Deltaproteobacteria bacterium]|nr:ferritin-like domain-containing protein [Deltaproteobacteria bacterium]